MEQHELETLTTAILSRLAGNSAQPRGGGLGTGSGVLPPKDLTHQDPFKARAARKEYCTALSDVGLEKCSKSEREIYLQECQAVLRDDGYFVG
jgi:hypothetical protein